MFDMLDCLWSLRHGKSTITLYYNNESRQWMRKETNDTTKDGLKHGYGRETWLGGEYKANMKTVKCVGSQRIGYEPVPETKHSRFTWTPSCSHNLIKCLHTLKMRTLPKATVRLDNAGG